MKNSFVALLLALAITVGSCVNQRGTTELIDLGEISPGEKCSGEFRVKCDCAVDPSAVQVRSSCGCVASSLRSVNEGNEFFLVIGYVFTEPTLAGPFQAAITIDSREIQRPIRRHLNAFVKSAYRIFCMPKRIRIVFADSQSRGFGKAVLYGPTRALQAVPPVIEITPDKTVDIPINVTLKKSDIGFSRIEVHFTAERSLASTLPETVIRFRVNDVHDETSQLVALDATFE